MMQLYEQLRPHTWREVVGQADAVKRCRHILAKGWGGRAWWITGLSGTGKTTIARIIASEGAVDCCTFESDASELDPAGIRKIEASMVMYGFPPLCGRVWIINEAHGLRRSDTIRQLLVTLERLPDHVCVIFTTTTAGEQLLLDDKVDADPLLSRCHVIRLTTVGLAQSFARYARKVAGREGVNGPMADYRHLAERHKCNLRAMLQEIDGGGLLESAPKPTRAKPRRGSTAKECPVCGTEIKNRQKFCSTDCYFKHLRSNKRKG